jgi:hypothetical protein
VRLEPSKIVRRQIEFQEIAQAAIDRVEILPRAIRRDVAGTAIEMLRVRRIERSLGLKYVHGGASSGN